MKTDAANITAPCWSEKKCASLIAAARRSQFGRDMLEDAMRFHKEDGYAMDVALKMSANYWLT